MRGGKSFLILLVIAAGLGGYAYYLSKHEPDATEGATKSTKVFPKAEIEKMQDLEVHAANGDVTHLKKDGATWKITAPANVDADPSEGATLASTVASLESSRVIDPNPTSLKDFGLDPARVMITFTQTGDTATHTLYVGSKTPTGSDLYARADGQPALFLIAGSLDDSLNKTTFGLRDKTVLKFQRDGADMVTLTASGKTISLEKKGSNEWRMKSPVDARADFSAVDGVVGHLAQLQMKSIVTADGEKDLKKYGLDKPDMTATIGAGSTRASIALGGKSPDGTLYARDLSRPVIFTVDATAADDFKKKADDFRTKDLFEFRSFNATSLEITQGGQTYAFTKNKVGDAYVWSQVKPAAKDVDQTKMTDLLSAVSGLRADSFTEASSGGDTIIVVAQFGDAIPAREERVTFHKNGMKVQASRSDDAGAAVVPSADFDKALDALKALTGGK